jgi:DNA mismatch repair protein MutS
LFVKFPAREALVPPDRAEWASTLPAWAHNPPPITVRPECEFEWAQANSVLQAHFGAERVDACGFYEGELVLRAAGALLRYVQETQQRFLPHVRALRPYRPTDFLSLDVSTQRNLEVTESHFERAPEGSLLAILDRTMTGMGHRRLKFWVLHPLLSPSEIGRRQQAIAELIASPTLRQQVRGLLKSILDVERLTSRLTSEIARSRDLISLRASLAPLPALRDLLATSESHLLQEIVSQLDPLTDVRERIEQTLLDEPSATLTEGGLIREGVLASLDEWRAHMTQTQQALVALEQRERDRTRIPSLKVGYNKIFGYYIEVTKPHLKSVPKEYLRKQTVATGERYITPELQHLEAEILTAAERSQALEYQLFCELRRWVADQADRLRRAADLVATLDALASLAEVAATRGWKAPIVDEGYALEICEGRHPTVETASAPFVPNDLHLTEERFLLIVTGPNMAGKSTYARQAALLVLLAQMGSFLPVQSARIGIVDRIFTRVGAADRLAHGLSTFMLEMTETAHILQHATPRSLVILDEVGRGTGTADGLAIAQAVIEYLVQRVRAKTIFTTHYHEVTSLASHHRGVANACLQVHEAGDEVTFLYKVLPGVANKSYGIHVASLAGLPEVVVARAAALLLQQTQDPACMTLPDPAPEVADRPPQTPLLEERLRRIDPLHTSPFDALRLLHELRELLIRGAACDPTPTAVSRSRAEA